MNISEVVKNETVIKTDSYICYINYNGKLCLAKNKITGRFVRLAVAQIELDSFFALSVATTSLIVLAVLCEGLDSVKQKFLKLYYKTEFLDYAIITLSAFIFYLIKITDFSQ